MLLNDTSHHKACPFFLYPTVVTCRRRALSNPSSLPSPHDRLAVVHCRRHPPLPLLNALFVTVASQPPCRFPFLCLHPSHHGLFPSSRQKACHHEKGLCAYLGTSKYVGNAPRPAPTRHCWPDEMILPTTATTTSASANAFLLPRGRSSAANRRLPHPSTCAPCDLRLAGRRRRRRVGARPLAAAAAGRGGSRRGRDRGGCHRSSSPR